MQGDMRVLFSHLCRDDTPMVRRAAGQNLAAFAKIVEPEWVSAEFIPHFHHLTQDGGPLAPSTHTPPPTSYGHRRSPTHPTTHCTALRPSLPPTPL